MEKFKVGDLVRYIQSEDPNDYYILEIMDIYTYGSIVMVEGKILEHRGYSDDVLGVVFKNLHADNYELMITIEDVENKFQQALKKLENML